MAGTDPGIFQRGRGGGVEESKRGTQTSWSLRFQTADIAAACSTNVKLILFPSSIFSVTLFLLKFVFYSAYNIYMLINEIETILVGENTTTCM